MTYITFKNNTEIAIELEDKSYYTLVDTLECNIGGYMFLRGEGKEVNVCLDEIILVERVF